MAAKLESIDDLRPAPYNPRRIKPKSAEALARSLEQYGDISGITWNSRTGHLVTGHQRLKQLVKQGAELRSRNDHPVLVLPDGVAEDGANVFTIRIVDWPLKREKEANVLANHTLLGGEFFNQEDVLADIKASMDPGLFSEFMLDKLQVNIHDVDLGDGQVDDRGATKRFAVFVPVDDKKAKGALTELAAAHNGYIAECTDENCDLSVRDLDTNAWSKRRDKLNPQAAAKRKDRGSESQDDT